MPRPNAVGLVCSLSSFPWDVLYFFKMLIQVFPYFRRFSSNFLELFVLSPRHLLHFQHYSFGCFLTDLHFGSHASNFQILFLLHSSLLQFYLCDILQISQTMQLRIFPKLPLIYWTQTFPLVACSQFLPLSPLLSFSSLSSHSDLL